MSNKRVVTSAIDGMSVSKVRRGLDTMRRMWREQNQEKPFFISRAVVDNMPMHQFALKFVMGHHYKRHNKSTGKSGSAAEQRDAVDDDEVEGGASEEDEREEKAAEIPSPKRMRTRSKK